MKMTLILFSLITVTLLAQERPSIHQVQSEYYRDNPGEATPGSLSKAPRRSDLASAKLVNAVVYGFHPYWQNGSETNYYFSLLTHLAYFSAEVDPNDGSFSTTRSWSIASVVTTAKQHGVKVHLTVTLFANHGTLLNNSVARSNLISNILSQIALRSADGCNVDFEGVSAANAAAFHSFIFDLGTALKAEGLELVVELPAVDWSGVFASSFFSTTGSVVDYYFLMAYDYYWSGSSTAGPVAPLTTGTSIRHVTRSFSYYLGVGCPAAKLIGGFPYYGLEWPVSGSDRMASVVTSRGTGTSRTYTALRSLLPGLASSDKFFDASYQVPWYRYDSSATGSWRQGWHDDEVSLARKYDSVKAYGLGGTGMWALGYDGVYTELWSALKNAFASTPNPTHTSLDAFETGVGHFDRSPTYSGSTVGVSSSSTAAWSNDRANNGYGSLQVTLVDRSDTTASWKVRLVSGSGAVSNNVTLNDGGYIGFWMRTTSAPTGAQIGLLVDDSTGGTERSPMLTVANSEDWQLYQFNTNGTGWTSFASGNGAVDGPTFTLDAIYMTAPDASPNWTLHIDDVSYNTAGPLPVQLAGLWAEPTPDGVRLSWTTSSEVDNYGFDIERRLVSAPGQGPASFEPIGFVSGHGTDTRGHAYAYVDRSAPPGRLAYRLRQIDRSGAFSYTRELEVESSIVPSDHLFIHAYPNPFNPSTTVEFRSLSSGWAVVRIYDMLGRTMATIFEGDVGGGTAVRATFDATTLPSGLYIARVEQSGRSKATKLLLSR